MKNDQNTLTNEKKKELIDKILSFPENSKTSDLLQKVHEEEVWRSPIPKWSLPMVGFGVIISFIYLILPDSYFPCKFYYCIGGKVPLFDLLIYGIWTFGIPSFFLFEYLYLFPYKLDSAQVSDLKYTHELASKMWTAIFVIFGGILLMKYGVRP